MLQDNVQSGGRQAHLAHAAVVGLHALCCGGPILAAMLAAASGAASGAVGLAARSATLHALLHRHELWVLLLSASLLAGGAAMEFSARQSGSLRGFPWLLLLSAACLLANVVIVAVHRL